MGCLFYLALVHSILLLKYRVCFLHGECTAMALEEGPRSCLLRARHKLEQDIKPTYLMDHMISDGVLTSDEEEKIRTQVGHVVVQWLRW